jgi:hypothetical protein
MKCALFLVLVVAFAMVPNEPIWRAPWEIQAAAKGAIAAALRSR